LERLYFNNWDLADVNWDENYIDSRKEAYSDAEVTTYEIGKFTRRYDIQVRRRDFERWIMDNTEDDVPSSDTSAAHDDSDRKSHKRTGPRSGPYQAMVQEHLKGLKPGIFDRFDGLGREELLKHLKPLIEKQYHRLSEKRDFPSDRTFYEFARKAIKADADRREREELADPE
jgi:hypothetical protein